MPNSNYLICRVLALKNNLYLGAIENVPNWARMMHGTRQKESFPKNACFHPDKNVPKPYNKLFDCLSNTNNFLVLSEKFVNILTSLDALKQNAVYPIAIYNHANKPIREKYFLVHSYDFPVCIDETKTIGVKSSIDKTQYITVEKIVLDETKVDSKLAVFRAAQYSGIAFFQRDIVDEIKKAGITGIAFREIEDYRGV